MAGNVHRAHQLRTLRIGEVETVEEVADQRTTLLIGTDPLCRREVEEVIGGMKAEEGGLLGDLHGEEGFRCIGVPKVEEIDAGVAGFLFPCAVPFVYRFVLLSRPVGFDLTVAAPFRSGDTLPLFRFDAVETLIGTESEEASVDLDDIVTG
ncbi:MAG: hypothetical protein D6812_01700, partial [Deltaproteobacteria bacterium]